MGHLFDEIYAALTARLEGRERKDLVVRSAAISQGYRNARPSGAVVKTVEDALAYAMVRAPATYAAVGWVLDELRMRAPGFVPESVLDAGAGPGTASWSALEIWPEARATLLDVNPVFRSLAAALVADSLGSNERLEIKAGDIRSPAATSRSYDLIVAAYALTELDDALCIEAARSLWRAAADALVIVEPGRSREYHRLLAIREAILSEGGKLVAPCPHEQACPLTDGDWCHFAVRLPRRRMHMQLKQGRMGYEDEKFSYLVFVRPHMAFEPPAARIIAPPVMRKQGLGLRLCESVGTANHAEIRKSDSRYKRIKKHRWGDALTGDHAAEN